MDMQNVAKLNIPEGEVRTIHDKDGNLIWGKVSYGVKYKGNTVQQIYAGKNLVKPVTSSTVTSSYNDITGEYSVSKATAASWPWLTGFCTLSQTITSGTTITISRNVGSSFNFWVRTYHADNTYGSYNLGTTTLSQVITEEKDIDRIVVMANAVPDNFSYSFKLQVELGNQATSFEPYVGGIPSPNPDYPQPIQTVTGENVVKISDGQGNEQSYPISLGSLELSKLGIYQDYIYPSGGKWYVHKEVGKVVLDGSENWHGSGAPTASGVKAYYHTIGSEAHDWKQGLCNIAAIIGQADWTTDAGKQAGNAALTGDNVYLKISKTDAPTAADLKTFLASQPMIVYYPLDTPTDTKITNEALVAQLEAVEQWLTRYGYNATVTGNLPIVIDRTAL